MSDCHTYKGTDGMTRCDHTHAYWYAAALLVVCPYCGADPYELCTTLPTYHPTMRTLVGGGNVRGVAAECHTGRIYEGHELLARLLTAAGYGRRIPEDQPPTPTLRPDDVVAIVEAVLAQRARPTRKAPARKPARKATARK